MSLDIAQAKRRAALTALVNVVAVAAALAAGYGYFKLHIDSMLYAFAAALLVGFGAQIWFIAGLRRAIRGA